MSKILAFDTSTEACSVALNIDGSVISYFEVIPRQHSERILPMIDRILSDADIRPSQLDALAFGCGPGAFTGLRIATGVVQGLAFALEKPVIPVSTLAALAQQSYRRFASRYVLASLDARMDEIYWGSYGLNGELMRLIDMEIVSAPQLVSAPDSGTAWAGIGSGWLYQERISPSVVRCDVDVYPHAEDIAVLAAQNFADGETVSADKAMPVYLRNKVAKKRGEQ